MPPAWNTGCRVGQRVPFTARHVRAIARHLRCQPLELALFTLGIDTMLRVSDMRQLRARDICTDGRIAQTFRLRQQKTATVVHPTLTAFTRRACQRWLLESGKTGEDFLFTLPTAHQPVSSNWCRRAVKRWAVAIGLSPEQYSMHSLRRTKPTHLYFEEGVELAVIAQLLGHRSLATTTAYLHIAEAKARQVALAGDLFAPRRRANRSQSGWLTDGDCDRIAERVCQRLRDQPTGSTQHTPPTEPTKRT